MLHMLSNHLSDQSTDYTIGENAMSDHSHGNLPFSNLTQIGVVVKNMDQTLERLSSLGIGPFEHRAVPSGAKEWYGDEPMHATFKITAAVVGGVEMEFIEPTDGKSPHKDFLDAKGEGVQSIWPFPLIIWKRPLKP